MKYLYNTSKKFADCFTIIKYAKKDYQTKKIGTNV